MSSIYANCGVDLDMIFYTGTGANTTDIIDDTGQDIGYKYSAGSVDWDTGLVAASGQDIGRILGGEVLEIWRSEEILNNPSSRKAREIYFASADSAISKGWSYISLFSHTSSKWTKVTNTSENLSIGYHSAMGSTPYYSAYAFHVTMANATSSCDVAFRAPTTSDGSVWVSETRSPNICTKNFVVCGIGGRDYDYDTVDADIGVSYVHWAVYTYRTMKITASVGGVLTRTYNVKWQY